MLDIKFIRDNRELVEKNNISRNVKIDLTALLELDKEKNDLVQKTDTLRAERNKRSKTKPTEEEISLMKKLGDEIADFEELMEEKEEALKKVLLKIPNINHESVPQGKDDSENQVIRKNGEPPIFNFQPLEHFDVAHTKELIDMERGVKVTGSRFYYLKGKLAVLERAIMQYALDFMQQRGFELILPPILVKEEAMFGTGFFPADKKDIYSVNPDEDDLFLIGTSEVPLIYMHSNEILETTHLPMKYVAVSPCFRRESGSYGKDTKGLFRVHQFYKVEMVVYCTPEQSWRIHEEIIKNEEDFITSLGIHYQVVNVCSGDLGFPAAKKYDCEGWFPGQGRYRELTSSSNTTDYQARRSNIKYKDTEGKRLTVHTLNGTVASDRPLLAIIENFQRADGSVVIPEVLRKYVHFDVI